MPKITRLPVDFYVTDEAKIVAFHDDQIAQNADLMAHAALINRSLDFLDWLLELRVHQDDEHLALLRLGVRCFNSCSAALRLLRCGHWQPAIMVTRDLYETQFLFDLLVSDVEKLKAWLTLPARERDQQFKPVKVREALDARDGFKEKKRAAKYKMLSIYGAHVTPEGFSIISPKNLTVIGPFPDQKLLKSALEELAMITAHSASTISRIVEPNDLKGMKRKIAFLEFVETWRRHFLDWGKGTADQEGQ